MRRAAAVLTTAAALTLTLAAPANAAPIPDNGWKASGTAQVGSSNCLRMLPSSPCIRLI